MAEQPRPTYPAYPLSPTGYAAPRAGTGRAAQALLLASLATLAACGDGSKEAPRQVAARVNAEEISILQVNHAVARLPDAPPERFGKQRREALDLLIDQQLAAQAAVKEGLDREPDVIGSLAAARSEVLARSYMNRLVAALPAPTDDEVLSYYDAHPLLYAQRRYYVLREIALPAKDAPVEALRAMTARGSVDKVAAWLREQGRTHSVSASTRPAEDIPPPVLQAVSRLRPGAATVVPTPDGVFIVHLVSTREAPLDAVAAQARIRRMLITERARGAMSAELARIRAGAKVEVRDDMLSDPARARQAGTVKVVEPLNDAVRSGVQTGAQGSAQSPVQAQARTSPAAPAAQTR